MERIVINSGLNGFILLDEIMETNAESMTAHKRFVDVPVWLGMESLAQLGALHVRFLTGFERHAFLLAVKSCKMISKDLLNGEFHLHARLKAHSLSAFSYELRAVERGPGREDLLRMEGELLFATVEYDTVFKGEILQAHYRKVFSCLKKGSRTGC